MQGYSSQQSQKFWRTARRSSIKATHRRSCDISVFICPISFIDQKPSKSEQMLQFTEICIFRPIIEVIIGKQL